MDTFNFTTALPERTTNVNTQRAYYRWVDRYLVQVAGLKPTQGDLRIERMRKLPLDVLQAHLTAENLRAWLADMVAAGNGRQSLDQARAALVTLAELMGQHHAMDAEQARLVRAVSVPSIAKNPMPETLLNAAQLQQLMAAARDMATSENQMLRNNVIASMLCTMALRREELSSAKWGDLTVQEGTVVLTMPGGDKVPIQRNVVNNIDRWRRALIGTGNEPPRYSALIRRIWKGGRIAKVGLSPDGIWLIIRDASRFAGLGHVTPDDLRRSAAANLRDSGVPVEEISRLLRHRNITITERFLARLPKSKPD